MTTGESIGKMYEDMKILELDINVTIPKDKKNNWEMETFETKSLEIKIYEINGIKLPLYNDLVLTPSYIEKVYSSKDILNGKGSEIKKEEFLERVLESENDLFFISNGDAKHLYDALNRLSENMIKGLDKNHCDILAQSWQKKGLI